MAIGEAPEGRLLRELRGAPQRAGRRRRRAAAQRRSTAQEAVCWCCQRFQQPTTRTWACGSDGTSSRRPVKKRRCGPLACLAAPAASCPLLRFRRARAALTRACRRCTCGGTVRRHATPVTQAPRVCTGFCRCCRSCCTASRQASHAPGSALQPCRDCKLQSRSLAPDIGFCASRQCGYLLARGESRLEVFPLKLVAVYCLHAHYCIILYAQIHILVPPGAWRPS